MFFVGNRVNLLVFSFAKHANADLANDIKDEFLFGESAFTDLANKMRCVVDQEIFVGRKEEIHELNTLLKKKSASFVVIKGHRRIGKSRLLEEFSRGKRTFKFTGLAPQESTTKQSQLDEFSRQLSAATGLPEVQADDWSKFFFSSS